MNNRVRHLTWTGLLLAGLTIVDGAPWRDALPVFGAKTLAAQTVQQEEVARFLEARRAINAEEFERAVALFQAVRTESSLSTPPFEPDSYYWEAFARYRLGDLAEARLLLEILMVGFREARPAEPRLHREAGRLYHDARALDFEIRSQLASQGDADDAERLLREAEETLDAAATTPGFRVMPMQVGDRTLTLPVRVADLTALPDSLAADSLAVAQDAQGEPDPQDAEDYFRRLAGSAESIADFERQVADYARLASDVDLLQADWQRAEYQEACAPHRRSGGRATMSRCSWRRSRRSCATRTRSTGCRCFAMSWTVTTSVRRGFTRRRSDSSREREPGKPRTFSSASSRPIRRDPSAGTRCRKCGVSTPGMRTRCSSRRSRTRTTTPCRAMRSKPSAGVRSRGRRPAPRGCSMASATAP